METMNAFNALLYGWRAWVAAVLAIMAYIGLTASGKDAWKQQLTGGACAVLAVLAMAGKYVWLGAIAAAVWLALIFRAKFGQRDSDPYWKPSEP